MSQSCSGNVAYFALVQNRSKQARRFLGLECGHIDRMAVCFGDDWRILFSLRCDMHPREVSLQYMVIYNLSSTSKDPPQTEHMALVSHTCSLCSITLEKGLTSSALRASLRNTWRHATRKQSPKPPRSRLLEHAFCLSPKF